MIVQYRILTRLGVHTILIFFYFQMSSKYVDKEFDDIDEEIDSSEKLYQVKIFKVAD